MSSPGGCLSVPPYGPHHQQHHCRETVPPLWTPVPEGHSPGLSPVDYATSVPAGHLTPKPLYRQSHPQGCPLSIHSFSVPILHSLSEHFLLTIPLLVGPITLSTSGRTTLDWLVGPRRPWDGRIPGGYLRSLPLCLWALSLLCGPRRRPS